MTPDRTKRTWTRIALIVMILTAATAALAAERHIVQIKDKAYAPAKLTIQAGDTVVWQNKDQNDHVVVGANEAFKSPNIKPAGTFSHTFTKAGTYPYSCTYHPREKGAIVVQ